MNPLASGHLDLALPEGTPLFNSNYRIQHVIGTGGFSIAYAAEDQNLNRRVAIKEFFPEGCTRAGLEVQPPSTISPEAFEQAERSFMAEARHLARFRHPNIVTAHAFFEENQTAYLVMEFLEGQTLRAKVEQSGPLSEAEALDVIRKIGEALHTIHENPEEKLLHRDVNPNNIMLCNDGRVVLMDFGLTQVIETRTSYQTRLMNDAPVFFTPGFAAPEQYSKNAEVSPATDVYGLAATLYFLLSGKVPLDAQSRWMGNFDTLPELKVFAASLSSAVNDAVKQALAATPKDRPQSVQAFLQLLPGAVSPAASPASNFPKRPTPAVPAQSPKASTTWAPNSPFPFKQASAHSVQELVELCERFPEEALEFFSNGSLANWIKSSQREPLLAGHIQGARQDVIRNLSALPESARSEDKELRRGAEMMMRHLYRAVGQPSLPIIATEPAQIHLGNITSGKLHTTRFRLENQGRGEASGTIEFEPESAGITFKPRFENLREVVDVSVDSAKFPVGEFKGHFLIRGTGLPRVAKVPLSFQITPVELSLVPGSIDFGKIRAGDSKVQEVKFGLSPADGRIVGSAYRMWGGNLENRDHYCDLDGVASSLEIRIAPPLSAVRPWPHKEVFRLVTNAGIHDIPVQYKVVLF